MIADYHQFRIQPVRSAVSILVAPIQYTVNWPVQLFDWLHSSISTHQELLAENARLSAQQILLQAQLQKLLAVENENAELHALLKSSPRLGNARLQSAQLLAVDSDPALQQVVVDKGSRQGVFVGQPVLDATGVLGQVVQVGPFTSHIMLITDLRSAVPIQDSRNGVRAIAMGSGAMGYLTLAHIPDTTDIKTGDVLVTSGLDDRYPAGYPVGTVKTIVNSSGEHFATITVEPTAKLDRSTQILLVWQQRLTPMHVSDNKLTADTHDKSPKKNKTL
jgi:rod shape-determining protein MreC